MIYTWLAFRMRHFEHFLYKFHRMYSKYDKMYEKHMNSAVKCTNNYVIVSKYYMFSLNPRINHIQYFFYIRQGIQTPRGEDSSHRVYQSILNPM